MPQAGTSEGGPLLPPGGETGHRGRERSRELGEGTFSVGTELGLSKMLDSEWQPHPPAPGCPGPGSATDCNFPCGSFRSFLLMEMGCSTTEVNAPETGPPGAGTGAQGGRFGQPLPGRLPGLALTPPLWAHFCARMPQGRTPASLAPSFPACPSASPSTLHSPISSPLPSLDLTAARSHRPKLSYLSYWWPTLRPDRNRQACPLPMDTGTHLHLWCWTLGLGETEGEGLFPPQRRTWGCSSRESAGLFSPCAGSRRVDMCHPGHECGTPALQSAPGRSPEFGGNCGDRDPEDPREGEDRRCQKWKEKQCEAV